MICDENDSNILHLYLTSFLMHIISENVRLNYLFLSSQLYSDVGRTGIVLVLYHSVGETAQNQ